MERTRWWRGGSVVVAVVGVAALVLHACASSDAMSSHPQMQMPQANRGSSENAAPNPSAAATTTDVDEDEGPYMPATKAGPGIVLSKSKSQKQSAP